MFNTVAGTVANGIEPGGARETVDARLAARTFGALADPFARFRREEAVRERLSALGRQSMAIAQEVRNPLMVIKGSAHALQAGGLRPEEVRAAAASIDREVARLDRIVFDLLDFARPPRVELASADVAALVWDAAGTILDGWEGPHVRLALQADVGRIVTDAERLRGVLASLLDNAREAVRAAGRAAGVDAIEIGGRRVASCGLLLWVQDRGAGVAAADLPHVFEPFFTTKRRGTGLGLAVARKVVEALGGTIRMESREGRGTRVEIVLPADATPTARA